MLFKVRRLMLAGGPADFDCEDENGKIHHFDLLVSGDLPDKYIEDPNLLIGSTITVGRMTPYLSIAGDIIIVEEKAK